MKHYKEIAGWYSNGLYRLELARERVALSNSDRSEFPADVRQAWCAMDKIVAAEQYGFAAECMLKDLIRVEEKDFSRRGRDGHDVVKLFSTLSPDRGKVIRDGVNLIADAAGSFDRSLDELRFAFPSWRYTPTDGGVGGITPHLADILVTAVGTMLYNEINDFKAVREGLQIELPSIYMQ